MVAEVRYNGLVPRRLSHIVLTRFNVPTGYGPEPDDEWLGQRVDLFEQICLPSMHAQIDPRHRWLVLFGEGSPPWLRDRIEGWQRVVPMVAVFDDRWSTNVSSHVTDLLDAGVTHVLTSRLDNDDALAMDMLAVVRSAAEGHDRVALDVPSGVVVDLDQKLARLVERSNTPFVSLLEPVGAGLRTVLGWNHSHIDEAAPVVVVPTDEAAWLQVVHGKNALNRLPEGGLALGLHLVASAIERRFGVELP